MKLTRYLAACLLATACARSSPREPVAEILSVEPVTPAPLAPELLSRADAQPRSAGIRALARGSFDINVQDADLPGLLLGLGRGVPLNIVVGPGVTGTVDADLEDVSLLEILEQIVRPRGLHYRIEGRTVRIFRTDRETRFYYLNYPSTLRNGTADFTVSGAIAQEIDVTGDGGGTQADDKSTSNLTTRYELDFWTELERGLRALVFGSGTGVDGAESASAGEGATEQTTPGLPARRVLISRQSGLAMVTAPNAVLADVDRYVHQVARSLARQVILDAKIIEISVGDEFDLGLEVEYSPGYDNNAGTIVRSITGGLGGLDNAIAEQDLLPTLTSGGFTFGIANENVGVVLRALARQSDIRVLSTPRIATLSNHKALIKIVRNEVFFVSDTEAEVVEGVGVATVTDFEPSVIPIGVTLDVTPAVAEDGVITLHIHPSISEIVEIRDQPRVAGQTENGSLPVVDIRETDTVLRVEDGQTVIIGGLRQSREFDVERKVPLLGDIPWIGQLFRGSDVEERESELVIFLTPIVLDAPAIEKVVANSYARLDELDDMRLDRRMAREPWWRISRRAESF